MRLTVRLDWIRLALAAVAAAALLLSIPLNIVSHAPAIQAASTEAGGQPEAHSHDHDHGHDDDGVGDDADSFEGQGHTHGHNPGDHSHDPPQQGSARTLSRTEMTSAPARSSLASVPRSPVFRLERPPRT